MIELGAGTQGPTRRAGKEAAVMDALSLWVPESPESQRLVEGRRICDFMLCLGFEDEASRAKSAEQAESVNWLSEKALGSVQARTLERRKGEGPWWLLVVGRLALGSERSKEVLAGAGFVREAQERAMWFEGDGVGGMRCKEGALWQLFLY